MAHQHDTPNYNRAFSLLNVGVSLNIVFVGVEATYGILTGSLALPRRWPTPDTT